MSEYIYLSSDRPLNVRNTREFIFSSNFDEVERAFFSFSPHFQHKEYQACTYSGELPDKKKMQKLQKGGSINQATTNKLFDIIVNQFNEANCETLELLFAYNGYENEKISEKKLIPFAELSPKDLYFQHMRLLTIKKNASQNN